MLKALGWIVALVILAIIGIGAYVFFNAGGLAKSGIEEFGPQYLGTSVNVDAVDLSLTDGSAEVRGLAIGNPAGYEGAHSMKVGKISAAIDPARTTETLIVLKSINIDGADIAAIAKGKQTNFQALMDYLDNQVADADEGAADTGPEIKFIVDQLNFTNAKASLNSDILGEVAMDIPPITLADIGKKTDGATGAELAQQLLEPLTNAISREAVNQGLDIEGVKGRVEQKIRDKLGDRFKSLTDRLKK